MEGTELDRYEEALQEPRERLARNAALRAVISGEADPRRVELMLVAYAVSGVAMTEPVEGWIRGAAARCHELGYEELGDAFLRHAKSEAGHHHMMISDLRVLTDRCKVRGAVPLDPDALLSRPPTPAVQEYVRLHEAVIEGPHPYAQLAVEYEIENLSAQYGPVVIEGCRARLGEEIRDAMSFLIDHSRADVGHTDFNRRHLAAFLARHPAALQPMIDAGTQALRIYGRTLEECLEFADAQMATTS